MRKTVSQLFDEATFDETRIVSGVYFPYIPLQVYGEPMRYSITAAQYDKFAKLIIQEVYSTLEDLAFCDGVPGVAEWIRDHLQKEYQVTLEYDPELDELK